jgi:hypothetical protein
LELKTFSNDLKDEFYRTSTIAVDLVTIALPDETGTVTESSTLRLCNGGFNVKINIGGTDYTYKAQGDFMGFSTISEEFDVKLGKFSIYLSGLASGMVDRFLSRDFEGQAVKIRKVFLNRNTLAIVDQPIVIFEGVIFNVSIVESAVTCSITVDCSTLWADFDRKAGRMTDNHSNWAFQRSTVDKCFSKSGIVGQSDMKWGQV